MPLLRLTRYQPKYELKVLHPRLYARVKEDFGHISPVLNLLGRASEQQLSALEVLVQRAPMKGRMRAVEGENEDSDYYHCVAQACSSPNSLVKEVFQFYNMEVDLFLDGAEDEDQPEQLHRMVRTVSMELLVGGHDVP